MKVPRSLFYMGILDEKIYAVGGWIRPDRVSRSVERYHVQEDRWEHVACLGIGLHEHAGLSCFKIQIHGIRKSTHLLAPCAMSM